MKKLYTSKDISEKLNIGYWELDYLHRSGKIPYPEMIGKIRVYTEEEFENIKEYLSSRKI